MFNKDKSAVILAEFFGTFLLASVVLGTITLNGTLANLKISLPFLGSAAAGLTLALSVMIFGKISGSHINPAVTFGMWSARKISTPKAILYICAQLLAGLVTIILGSYLLGEELPALAVQGSIDWKVFVAEMIGTLVFTFGIAAAVSQKFEDGKLAAAIGISLFVGLSIASMGSNGILNPAVAVGINSINFSYLVAPLVGGLLGVNLYEAIFVSSSNKSVNSAPVKSNTPAKTVKTKASSKTKKTASKKTKK
jgi:glycerol uptake facilitator-like aquaporin